MNTKYASQKAINWPVIYRYLKKYAAWLVAFVVVTAVFLVYMKYYHTYSEGYKEGYLQKFSKKGNFFKTYEGELRLNDTAFQTTAMPSISSFTFSVTSQKLARQFDTIQQKFLIVHYRQKNGILSWRGESEFIVDSVKIKK